MPLARNPAMHLAADLKSLRSETGHLVRLAHATTGPQSQAL